MNSDRYREKVRSLLELADIPLNEPSQTIPQGMIVHNDGFYARVLSHGSLGLGESYMDGWWDSPKLDEFFNHLLSARIDEKVRTPEMFLAAVGARLLNPQRKSRAFEIGEHHYDIGNDLYTRMLDSSMSYSCGYWKNAQTLEEAQQSKLELICRKLQFKPGMSLLDIGCGWGGLAYHAAKNYGVKVVGVTVSKEQIAFASEKCKSLPVEIRFQDYRDLSKSKEKFNRIVSVGMFEHVGVKNYCKFMKIARNLLADDPSASDESLFLLHTIGGLKSRTTTDPWISKYIFPRSMLPSLPQITTATENIFVIEDVHNLSTDYDKTLMAWHGNFNKHWPGIADEYAKRSDGKFKRMWNYYLLSCAGSFRARKNQIWQIVLSKNGVPDGYTPVR